MPAPNDPIHYQNWIESQRELAFSNGSAERIIKMNLENNPAKRPDVKKKISAAMYKTGIGLYREKARLLLGDNCQICGNYGRIVHHKDGNPRNNPEDGSNWLIVCSSHHAKVHGIIPPNPTGRKHSPKTIKKMSVARINYYKRKGGG
jgi:hypothetical protein